MGAFGASWLLFQDQEYKGEKAASGNVFISIMNMCVRKSQIPT